MPLCLKHPKLMILCRVGCSCTEYICVCITHLHLLISGLQLYGRVPAPRGGPVQTNPDNPRPALRRHTGRPWHRTQVNDYQLIHFLKSFCFRQPLIEVIERVGFLPTLSRLSSERRRDPVSKDRCTMARQFISNFDHMC